MNRRIRHQLRHHPLGPARAGRLARRLPAFLRQRLRNPTEPKYGYATLNAREPMQPQIAHAIGNSMAPSMMASDKTEGTLSGGRPIADHSYLANRALWDDWFLSGIAPQTVATFSTTRAQRVVASSSSRARASCRWCATCPTPTGEIPAKLLACFSGHHSQRHRDPQHRQLIRVDRLFNVNSTSVEAWKAMLGALKGRQVVVRDASGAESHRRRRNESRWPTCLPAGRIAEGNGQHGREGAEPVGRPAGLNGRGDRRLARAIVKEVRKRGPFLSLADFVNRRLAATRNWPAPAAIQSALDSTEVEINSAYRTGTRAVGQDRSRAGFPEAEEGPAGFGIPGHRQAGRHPHADRARPVRPLGQLHHPRLRRVGGQERQGAGPRLVRGGGRARQEFVDDRYTGNRAANPKNNANQNFGRRYEMVSFRWLHQKKSDNPTP